MLNKNLQKKATNPIEIPDFISQLDYLDLLRLLKVPDLPEWFFLQALQHRVGRIWSLISRHPNITDRIKEKLIATQNGDICLYFAQQQNLSESLIFQLAQVEITDSSPSRNREIKKKIRCAISKKPNTKLDILQQLEGDIEYTVKINAKRRIASHPDTSLSVIEQLAFDAEPSIKKGVASRQDLPIELIREMAKDRQIARKGFLVRNHYFDSDLLDILAQDSHPRVQQLVALHPNTMEKTLVRLAKNPEIGIFILRNPNLTEELFEQLVSSNNPKLNFALAQHSRTSRETLENIAAKSEDAATLIAVIENNQTGKKTKSEILTRLAGFSSRSVRQYVAQNSCTPENILWGWGTSQRYYKLHPFIARNPTSPTMLLDYLAHKFFSQKVWKGLARNPNTSEDTFNYLYSKERKQSIVDGRIVFSIAKEHKIPSHILKKRKQSILNTRKLNVIAQKHKIPVYILDLLICNGHYVLRDGLHPLDAENENDITFELIDRLLKGGTYYRYRNRIHHIYPYLIQKCDLPLATIEFLLEQIAQSCKADKRKFAARHPKTPISVLETLVEDEDKGVREAAIVRLQQR